MRRLMGKSKPVVVVAVAMKMIQLSYIQVKSNGDLRVHQAAGSGSFPEKATMPQAY
jgi:hypothetical protein